MEKHVKLSRFISLILRHKPEAIGLTLDNQGYLLVDDLIKGLNATGNHIDRGMLDEIISTDNKGRYSYDSSETKIRANQGHSIKVDVELLEETPPTTLYHGTSGKHMDDIMKHGLSGMKRTYVHLSEDYDTAVNVGSRKGAPIILKVDTAKMIEVGHKFYISKNGVWLTDNVPTKFISRL